VLNTSTVELRIAGNQQQFESNFNVSEGGADSEGGKVGYTQQPWYAVSKPTELNQLLLPAFGSTAYDPGNDVPDAQEPTSIADVDPGDSTDWPRENLVGNYTANDTAMDYIYLVTYLYPDAPPKGYDISKHAGYKFRMNGEKVTKVEVGGIKIGVLSSN
jgi:hypothetical protein